MGVTANAQNISDVLRLGSEEMPGTPRYQAMAGAFGALGGDLSALSVNPAGSAVFNNGLFTITGNNSWRRNESNYFGHYNERSLNDININQVGGAFVFRTSNSDNPWKKVSLAFNYDMVRNYDDKLHISGDSDQGIDNYFLSFAQGVPFGSITLQDGEYLENAYLDIGSAQGYGDQQAFLGYYGGVIDPDSETDDNTGYHKNAIYDRVHQDFWRNTSGYNSKFTMNMATQYGENLYFGGSLNFHSVLVERYDEFTEDGYSPDSPIGFTVFDNLLRTEGSAFSFGLGAIVKINDLVRLGAGYQSPTWYRLSDELSQRIDSDLADQDINYINLNVINVFESYRIKIPGKFTGSMALVFGQVGLLSFDYTFQDMSNAQLRPEGDPSFQTENDVISNELGAVSSFRVGGEYRLGRLAFRGGYHFEQSPYTDGHTVGDLNGFSTGLGFSFGSSRLDFTFNRYERDRNVLMFDTGLTTPSRVNTAQTNLLLGYTLNF